LRGTREIKIDDAVVLSLSGLFPLVVERATEDVASLRSGPTTVEQGSQRDGLQGLAALCPMLALCQAVEQ